MDYSSIIIKWLMRLGIENSWKLAFTDTGFIELIVSALVYCTIMWKEHHDAMLIAEGKPPRGANAG